MRRLIGRERGASWDLVEEDGDVFVEHVRADRRVHFTLEEFRESDDGRRFAIRLDSMLERTGMIPPAPQPPPSAIFWFPRA